MVLNQLIILRDIFNEEEATELNDKRSRDSSDDDGIVPKQLKLSEQLA